MGLSLRCDSNCVEAKTGTHTHKRDARGRELTSVCTHREDSKEKSSVGAIHRSEAKTMAKRGRGG